MKRSFWNSNSSYIEVKLLTKNRTLRVYLDTSVSLYGLVPGFSIRILNLNILLLPEGAVLAASTPLTHAEVIHVPEQQYR